MIQSSTDSLPSPDIIGYAHKQICLAVCYESSNSITRIESSMCEVTKLLSSYDLSIMAILLVENSQDLSEETELYCHEQQIKLLCLNKISLETVKRRLFSPNLDEKLKQEVENYFHNSLRIFAPESNNESNESNKPTKTSTTNKFEKLFGKIERKRIESTKDKPSGFERIAGMHKLKDTLQNDVLEPMLNPELFKEYGISSLNGILLYGPPGCGKTHIANCLAEEAGFDFYEISTATVSNPYIGGTEELIKNTFEQAKKSRSIIFLDEIESLCPKRNTGINQHYINVLNTLLVLSNECSSHGIFLILASNRPDMIDPALLRSGRIDSNIYIPTPDETACIELFELYLKERPTDKINIKKLLKNKETLNKTFVASDIKTIIDNASRVALRKNSLVTEQMLEEEIKHFVSSITEDELVFYEKIHHRMSHNHNRKHNTIGFKIKSK